MDPMVRAGGEASACRRVDAPHPRGPAVRRRDEQNQRERAGTGVNAEPGPPLRQIASTASRPRAAVDRIERLLGSRDRRSPSKAECGGLASPVVHGPGPRRARIVAPNFGWVRESHGDSGRRKPVQGTGTTSTLKLRAESDPQAMPRDRMAHSAPHPQQSNPRLREPMRKPPSGGSARHGSPECRSDRQGTMCSRFVVAAGRWLATVVKADRARSDRRRAGQWPDEPGGSGGDRIHAPPKVQERDVLPSPGAFKQTRRSTGIPLASAVALQPTWIPRRRRRQAGVASLKRPIGLPRRR